MTPTTLARVAGVLGGVCWLGRAILDSADASAALVNGLHWGGLALVVIALLGIGAGLVSGLLALRVVVALCLTVLVGAVLQFLQGEYADRWVFGVSGVLVAVYCAAGLARARRTSGLARPARERSSGAHAG